MKAHQRFTHPSLHLTILLAAIGVSACGGSGIDGCYEGFPIDLQIKGSTVTSYMDSNPISEMKVERDGKRLKLDTPFGKQVLDIQDDGTLKGMGSTFKPCKDPKKLLGH